MVLKVMSWRWVVEGAVGPCSQILAGNSYRALNFFLLLDRKPSTGGKLFAEFRSRFFSGLFRFLEAKRCKARQRRRSWATVRRRDVKRQLKFRPARLAAEVEARSVGECAPRRLLVEAACKSTDKSVIWSLDPTNFANGKDNSWPLRQWERSNKASE
mmetsp:Transcript_36038/g.74107  ORF Transcript_36038/g.74107 Transcript_36038/m.74107 type:complete len:157 (-) Transcript_36038:28-498(-)